MKRLILVGALVAVVAAVPAASARTDGAQATQRAQVSQSIAEGVATAIAAEIVKTGIRAGVAKWAPEYYSVVDPTGAALAAIQEQLAQLDAKLTQLIDHQQALGERLSCEIQRTALGSTLSDIKGWFATLREQRLVTSQASRQANLESLFGERHRMASAQIYLHDSLVGNNLPNLLRSCARHIEETEKPFLSAYLQREVVNFWSLYRAAAAELLVVRANMVALHPDQFPANKAEEMGRTLERDWASEESLIKPAVPDWISYDKDSGWVWQTSTVRYEYKQTGYIDQLLKEGWHVTGYSEIPTCSAVEREYKKSGLTGSAAVSWMFNHNIVKLEGNRVIRCYDDDGRLHEFSLINYSYVYAGDFDSKAPVIVARPNEHDGKRELDIARFSYLG